MKVRIGVADTSKLIELEVDDADAFRQEIGRAIEDGSMAWFTDTKGRSVGVPGPRIAFAEIDEGGDSRVGFVPAG